MQEDLINILVVDDHKLVRQGLISLINSVKGFKVIGEANDGVEAIDILLKCKPQIMLLDINMPLLDGIETLKKIRELGLKVKIIIITESPNKRNIIRAIKYGANGFVTKNNDFKDILGVIKEVVNNKKILDPPLIKFIYEKEDIDLKGEDITKIESLSPREYEILELIALGDSNATISEKLFISEKTVKNHITNVYNKIQVVNRVEAVIFCYENKII